MTRPKLTPQMEFYAEWDDNDNVFYIYDTEEGFAWASFVGQKEAEKVAEEMEQEVKQRFNKEA